MKPTPFEDLFLDYIEGVLPEEQQRELEEALQHDHTLAKKLADYRSIIALEQRAATEDLAPSLGFANRVLEATKEREIGFLRRLSMGLVVENRRWFATGATVLAAGLLVVIANRTPHEMIAITRPVESVQVPASIGAVTELKQPALSEPKLNRPITNESAPGGAATTRERPAVDEKSLPLDIIYNDDRIYSSETLTAGTVGDLAESGISEDRAAGAPVSKAANLASQSVAPSAPLARGASVFYQDHVASFSVPVEQAERYRGEKPSQPILAAQSGVSTFSIDVDTASYTNVRRYLQSGNLPPPAAVRTEEFVNYFDYNYPEQFEKRFGVHYELAPSPLIKGHHLLKIGIRAKDVRDSEKPWNLVFLVDVSGSMSSPNKLALLQKSLKVLTANMRPQDRVALVTYANGSAVRLESTAGSDKTAINAAIDSLSAGGGTNGAGGIQLAYDVAMKSKIESGVNRVILATDGDFNVGVTSHEDLVKMIEEKRKLGVSLTTIGVGEGNLNDATLEQLADKGNGNYFYLDSFKEARKVFEKQLAGTIETVAKDVKIQVEFNPKNVVQYKLIGFENRTLAKQDFNNDAVDAGEIGSGHTVTALYDLVLAGTDAAKELATQDRYQEAKPTVAPTMSAPFAEEVAFLKIRSKAPEGERSDLEEFPILRSSINDSVDAATKDFRFAAAVAGFAESLRGNTMLPLAEIGALAQAARGSDETGIRQEFIELVKNAESVAKR